MSFSSMHRTFKFLACGLSVAGLARLLFVDPSSAQEATSVVPAGLTDPALQQSAPVARGSLALRALARLCVTGK